MAKQLNFLNNMWEDLEEDKKAILKELLKDIKNKKQNNEKI
jgi:hypothetical protein|tara:strand:- start:938 stop:1060 length:123 start_codon:yes stop_codon:yes gene_type:complete